MKTAPIIFHIRRALAKRGGNQYYKDKSVRKPETYCGAPVTEFDAAHKDRCVVEVDNRICCRDCSWRRFQNQ